MINDGTIYDRFETENRGDRNTKYKLGMAEQSLKDKTIKGTTWTALESLLRYGVSFVVGIILARLLSPDEYGLIGILTIFITIFEVIIDGGFINALIRKQDAKEIDYYTVFWTNLTLSIVMAGVLYAGSGLIAVFFKRSELVALMHVMSSIVVINALSLVQKARLTKAIDFKTQTKVSVLAALCSGLVGILMAYLGCGVWSLVAQQLSNAGIATLLYWLYNRWLPKLQFSIDSFLDMWNFGWKLLLSGIFNNISNQAHHIVIGKCFTPAILGQYTRANQFGSLFSGNLTSVIQKVTYPVLSEIQDEPTRLKAAYKRILKITVFPTFVLMLSLSACSRPLLIVLIGDKWVTAAYFLQIISFSMMLYPLHALNLNAIQVLGRSDLTLKINIIKNVLMVIPIIIGFLYNIYWMLVADVFRGYLCYYLNAYYTKFVMDYSVWEQIKDIIPSIKVSLIVALPAYIISYLPINNLIILLIQVFIIISIFFLVCENIKYPEYMELKNLAMHEVGKLKY